MPGGKLEVAKKKKRTTNLGVQLNWRLLLGHQVDGLGGGVPKWLLAPSRGGRGARGTVHGHAVVWDQDGLACGEEGPH